MFEQASGGTLFLDEIGELPSGAQAALLRVLETKKLIRVGGDRDISVDVRVVAATHRDLEALCTAGTFRADLYYRLHGVTIAVPPLRKRVDEIKPLAEAFLHEAAKNNARHVHAFDTAAMTALLEWSWPGNVRELKNVVERAVVVARNNVVALIDLPERVRHARAAEPSLVPPPPNVSTASAPNAPSPVPSSHPASDLDYKDRLRNEMARYERDLITNALSAANGNVTAAAQALRIPIRTLTHKIQALGIKKRFDSE